jgi:hypothetical protein
VTLGVPATPYAPVHSHVHLARTRALSGRHAVGHTTLRRRLRHLRRSLLQIPWLIKLGLLVLLVGATGDLTYHALPQANLQAWLGVQGYYAHLITFVGMLVMLIGVLRQGLSQSQSRSSSQGVLTHAHR